jgi:apolipoprotein D and lipocalin family protein
MMKRTLSSSIALCFWVLLVISVARPSNAQGTPAPTPGKLPTVASVDLARYQGTWFEVASIPAIFQRACVTETMAEYKLLENGVVQVLNSCEIADGSRQKAEGRARVNPKYGETSKLQVTFVKLLGSWVWTLSGDYWIVDLGADYEYAIVGHPNREYAWILSRTRTLPKETLLALRDKLQTLGYDPCALHMSRNAEQSYPANTRLCDLK